VSGEGVRAIGREMRPTRRRLAQRLPTELALVCSLGTDFRVET